MASPRMGSNLICAMQIPCGDCTFNTSIITFTVNLWYCRKRCTLHVHMSLSGTYRDSCMKAKKEREITTKNKGERCDSMLLMSLIAAMWRSVPGREKAQIILFVFYSLPAGHPDFPSYCFAPHQAQSPSSLPGCSPLAFSSVFHFPSYDPHVWYLTKLMHSWVMTYLHKAYSAVLGVGWSAAWRA